MVLGRGPRMVPVARLVPVSQLVPRVTVLRPLLCWLVLLTTIVAASFDFVVKPEFGEKPSDLNVTTFAGQTGRLPCTVRHLSGKRVSWIRGRDLQVLSTGRVTFSTDLRISVLPGTTKFKTRRPRHITSQLCHDCGPNLSNSTTGGASDDDQPIRRDHSRDSSHCLCFRSWKELHSDHETSATNGGTTQVVTNNISSDDQAMNIYDPHNTAPGGYSRRQTHVTGDVPRRVGSRDKRGPDRGKPRVRRGYEFRHKNTDYYRPKESLNALSKLSQYAGPSYYKPNQPSGKYYSDGEPQAYTQYDNPIAIYPQGPTSHSMENKGLQPGPNYIEGVWEPEDYTLQIKFTKPEDAGTYMCQINTEPRVSQEIQLSVVKMRAEIVGSSELFVKAGTPVTLACRVNHGTLMPGFILWYKGERLVEYDRSGGRIQVVTGVEGVSHLLLQDATTSDSANYTCSPSGGVPASLILNVIVDERQAAMQQGNSAPSSPSGLLLLPAAAAAVLTMLSWFTSDEASVSLVVSGVVWWWAAGGGPPHAHYCWATAAVLATMVMLSAVPLASQLTKTFPHPHQRRDCVPGHDLTLCHIQSVMLVVCVTLCVIVLLLCHSSRLQNYV